MRRIFRKPLRSLEQKPKLRAKPSLRMILSNLAARAWSGGTALSEYENRLRPVFYSDNGLIIRHLKVDSNNVGDGFTELTVGHCVDCRGGAGGERGSLSLGKGAADPEGFHIFQP